MTARISYIKIHTCKFVLINKAATETPKLKRKKAANLQVRTSTGRKPIGDKARDNIFSKAFFCAKLSKTNNYSAEKQSPQQNLLL